MAKRRLLCCSLLWLLACGEPEGSTAPRLALEDARGLAQADAPLRRRLQGAPGLEARPGEALFASRGYARPRVDTAAVAAPATADGALRVFAGIPSRGLALELTPDDAAPRPGEAIDGHVIYAGTHEDTDTIVSADDLSAEILYVLRSPRSPRSFRLRLSGEGAARAAREPGGTIAFLGDDGRPRLRVARPYAIDARGERREAELRLDAGSLTVTLDGSGLSYPVLLDPVVEAVVWRQLDDGSAPARPPPRYRSNMVYDEARDRTVLFGGETNLEDYPPHNGDPINDLWEWDGARWEQIVVAGDRPSPRRNTAMVYDPKRKVSLLFGGVLKSTDGNETLLNETWTWDGVQWKKLALDDPPPRKLAAMGYDRARGVAVFTGGFSNAPPGTISWEWDGAKWSQVPTNAPLFKQQCGVAWDPASKALIFDGGHDQLNGWTNSAMRWDGQGWTQFTPASKPRGQQAMATDLDREIVVTFGGIGLDSLTQELIGSTWVPVPTQGPPARHSNGMVYDRMRKKMLIFGGAGASGKVLDDTWEYDPALQRWTEKNIAPPPSIRGSLAFDKKRGEILFTGLHRFDGLGTDDDVGAGEMYVFDGRSWGRALPASTSRTDFSYSAFGYDEVAGQAVWFGGLNGALYSGDTWLWDGRDWKKSPAAFPSASFSSGPSGFAKATMRWDPGRKRLYAPYGTTDKQAENKIVEWNGSGWTVVAPTTDVRLFEYGMAYDHAAGGMLIHGGNNLDSTAGNQTRRREGGSAADFTLLGTYGPKIHFCPMDGDPHRKRVVRVGGQSTTGATPLPGTWEWDGIKWEEIPVSGSVPDARAWHDLVWEAPRLRMVMAGGTSDPASGGTWAYSRILSGCGATSECPSGLLCVDGVCCSSACGGGDPSDCISCAGKDTGDVDGACAPVKNGSTCGGTGQCAFGLCEGGSGAGGAGGQGGSGQGGAGASGQGGAGASGQSGAGQAGAGAAGQAGSGQAGAGGAGGAGQGGAAGSGEAGAGQAGSGQAGAAGEGGAGAGGLAGAAGSGDAGQGGAGAGGAGGSGGEAGLGGEGGGAGAGGQAGSAGAAGEAGSGGSGPGGSAGQGGNLGGSAGKGGAGSSGTSGQSGAAQAGQGGAGQGGAGQAGAGQAGAGQGGAGAAGAGQGKSPLDGILGSAAEDGGGCGCRAAPAAGGRGWGALWAALLVGRRLSRGRGSRAS